MAYCELTDINDQIDERDLISITDDDDTGSVDSDKVGAAIEKADAMIDSYLAVKYAVPMDPVPAIVKKLSVDIAVYELFSRRDRVSDSTRKRFDDAVTFLKDVAKGKAGISGATSADSSMSSNAPTMTTSPRVFSRIKMKGF